MCPPSQKQDCLTPRDRLPGHPRAGRHAEAYLREAQRRQRKACQSEELAKKWREYGGPLRCDPAEFAAFPCRPADVGQGDPAGHHAGLTRLRRLVARTTLAWVGITQTQIEALGEEPQAFRSSSTESTSDAKWPS